MTTTALLDTVTSGMISSGAAEDIYDALYPVKKWTEIDGVATFCKNHGITDNETFMIQFMNTFNTVCKDIY